MEEILKKIVDKRLKTLKEKGTDFGIEIPNKREVPIAKPDFNKGVIFCEIKRGSPSEGKINKIEKPEDWAEKYIEAGADAISILTEEDFFFGSLKDLINIKKRFPDIPVLRKDFLLSEEEIDISYRAGSDMILLITSVLIELDENKSINLLKRMKERAESLGLLPLIEVHNKEELEIVLKLKSKVIGINSRDLNTFKIKRGYPLGLKKLIPDSINVIYESGIRNYTDSFFIGAAGFNSILIGTSIIKSNKIKEKILSLKSGFINGKKNKSDFYNRIFHKIFIEKKLVVKICGITNIPDAECAIKEGADIIGFILAKSPRKIELNKAKDICMKIDKDVLKIGVVVDENIEEVVNAVKEGWLDAVQFHGDIDNDAASKYNVCWYKAIRVKNKDDFHKEYYCPIILYDAFIEESYGGTGKQIDNNLLDYAKNNNIDLYLAGGINPNNVRSIVDNYKPLLIDVGSGVEKSHGIKDHDKIRRLFENIKREII